MMSSVSLPPVSAVDNAATSSQRILSSEQGVDSVYNIVASENSNTGHLFSIITESTSTTGKDAEDTLSQGSVKMSVSRPTTESIGNTALSQFIQSPQEETASVVDSTTIAKTTIESNKCRLSQQIDEVSVSSTFQPHVPSSLSPPMDIYCPSISQDLLLTVSSPVGCNPLVISSSEQVHCANGMNHKQVSKTEVCLHNNNCVAHDKNMDMGLQVPNTAREEIQNISRGVKRKEGKDCVQVEEMDHSGLEHKAKRSKVTYKDGIMLCLSLSSDTLEKESLEEVSRELARCLHESKHILIQEVVRVLGVRTALNIFQQTSDIQVAGGQLVANGDQKKAPGGVFFSLVKQKATPEEKENIFRKDKQISERKKKRERRRKWIEKEKKKKDVLLKKADWELKVFRTEFIDCDHGPSLTEWDCSLAELTRKATRNKLEGRFTEPKRTKPRVTKECVHGCRMAGAEAMDFEANDIAGSKQSIGSSHDWNSVKVLDQETLAAQEFEEINECEVDISFDLA